MSMPTHSQIVNYWKDKCITDNYTIEIEGNYPYNRSIPVIKDLGEPRCWCCGLDINFEYLDNEIKDENSLKLLDKSKVKSYLNRCHIIPKSCNGKDDVDNLFLMCEPCHINSPDFADPKFLFMYVYEKRKSHINGIDFKKFSKSIIEKSIRFNKDIRTINLSNIDENKYTTHGGFMSESTIEAILIDSMDELTCDDKVEFIRNLINSIDILDK